MRGVVWIRRDLRLQDQPALTAACAECDEVIPLFVFDDPLLRARQFGAPCVTFMVSCLDELAAALADQGLALQWRRGDQIEEVLRFVVDVKADVVYWNRDYEPAAIHRDRKVQQALMAQGVVVHTFKDHVVFEAEEIRGSTGDPLQRYSAYRARWWTKWHAATPPLLPSPVRQRNQRAGGSSPKIALATGGSVSRRDLLTWIDELIWREFFLQILSAFPQVASGPFRSKDGLPRPRPAGAEWTRLYAAWCNGRTGYPLVDAGMKQLNQTGWMHNRVRMVAASFLIKDLRIDWQSGERYFMQQLIDADLAANNGNWQWASATGTDSMPGYRIFNPLLQSRKFDPEGAYIRQYVPELAAVPPDKIHAPHLMTRNEQHLAGCRIGLDYPAPIVDHRQAREEYLALAKQGNIA